MYVLFDRVNYGWNTIISTKSHAKVISFSTRWKQQKSALAHQTN